MTDTNFISSLHIQKLGHTLQEIRIRALNHILSKLDHGTISHTDFPRYLELLKKLFEWFDLEPQIEEEKVLNLIYRILKSDSGPSIMRHVGSIALISDLKDIQQNKLKKDYQSYLEKIIQFVTSSEDSTNIVPQLISDLPLSYRSDQTDNVNSARTKKYSAEIMNLDNIFSASCNVSQSLRHLSSFRSKVGTTASTISGIERKSSSASGLNAGDGLGDEQLTPDSVAPILNMLFKSIPFVTLNWQSLVKSDYHVIKSVEESLQKPSEPAVLMHSCDFFCNVMLQDFPAEVFLQRPAILTLFYDMIATSPSTRITNAALTCLNKLSDNLITRIRHFSDPCTYNLKQGTLICEPDSAVTSARKIFTYNIDMDTYLGGGDTESEDSNILQCNQISLPQFCMQTFVCVLCYVSEKPQTFKESSNKKKTQSGINTSLQLIDKLITLTTLCIKPSIWNNQNDVSLQNVAQQLTNCFDKLGNVLEQYRLMVVATDMEYFERMTQLHLLHSTAHLLVELVPILKADLVVPRALKTALSSSLLDASFGRLYPAAHEVLVQYANEFKGHYETESLTKYKDVQQVCFAITKAVKVLRYKEKNTTIKNLSLIRDSLPCFEFHKNLSLINIFLKICVKNNQIFNVDDAALKLISDILVTLLSHSDEDIRKETYFLCQKLIVNILGINHTKHMSENVPGSQVIFFFQPDILIELAAHGLNSNSIQIQTHAEDILIHILKCKFVVSETVWRKIIKAVSSAMPILQCHASYDTPLGKAIVKILDPDISPSIFLSSIDVLKGNLRMLFCKDIILRNEAVARLCWLLTTEEDSQLKIPKIKSLQDYGLGNIFQIEFPIDLSRKRSSHQFYQVSNLLQVTEILSTPDIEPSIRRSALTQISVMLEDHFLHSAFLETNGLEVILKTLNNSLNEKEYHNYPDSVIPIITILRHICLHNSIVRQELSQNKELIFNVLRGLFVYCTEKRMQQDAAMLCCLLLFSEFAIYCYSGKEFVSFSLPDILVQKLNMPFVCATHWKNSRFTKPSLTGLLMTDNWCKSTLRMHWNIEWYGGITELITWSKVPSIKELTPEQLAEFSTDLRLTAQDLLALKASSVFHCCQQYLYDIENATTHQSVQEAVRGVAGYTSLWLLANNSEIKHNPLIDLNWANAFYRFLSAPPANIEDQNLLIEILSCLRIMLKLYKNSGRSCWIAETIQDPSHYLSNLIMIDVKSEFRIISLELLSLIADCSLLEQHLFDTAMITENEERIPRPKTKNWINIIKIITENLKFSDTEQFYNLAYLDKLLLSLVQITSNLGWSEYHLNSSEFQKIFSELIEALSELLIAFHCGKGPEAASSFMGLNITRNALLSMNHILYEMQQSAKKSWETFWVNDTVCSATVFSLFSLWSCRDVVVRAATLQLLAGLSMSSRGATIIVENVRQKFGGVWETTLMILLDHSEASIVREQAAMLLTNLCSHLNTSASGQVTLPLCHAPLSSNNQDISAGDTLILLLKEYNFFEELDVLLSCLHLEATFEPSWNFLTQHKTIPHNVSAATSARSYVPTSTESSKSDEHGVTVYATPSLVKSVANFVSNLLFLSPTKISDALAESGLVRGFFRCLSNPSLDLSDSRQFLLYIDTMEMCSAISSLLTRCIVINNACRVMALHTRDSLYILISLLNTTLYNVSRPHFLYLRNLLWSEIFRLLTALLEIQTEKNTKEFIESSKESYNIISSVLAECGQKVFINSVCESIESKSGFLQKSALQSLTSLLTIETILPARTLDNSASFISLQSFMDTTKSPRYCTSENLENIENICPVSENITPTTTQRFKISQSLAETYRNTMFKASDASLSKSKKSVFGKRSSDNLENLMIGADLCKILMRLYEMHNIETNKDNKRKAVIVGALSSLLILSEEAKKCALSEGLLSIVLTQLKNLHVELSCHSAESLRKISDKKKICPILKEVDSLFNLLTNFLVGNENSKNSASGFGVADLIHKYWIWFSLEQNMLINVLKLLCTFTTNCENASQSLTLTNPIPGSGPRKAATNISLLNAIILLVVKEMDLISRSHDLFVLQLSFHILQNVSSVLECRTVIAKSNVFQCMSKLHPAITKRQKPWESVEYLWLEFLESYTFYPEGQIHVTKTNDVLELLMILTSSSRMTNKISALCVLRNMAFHHSNRIKLISTVEFVQILHNKLLSGTFEEKNIVVSIVWALVANSQRSKIALKCAGLDTRMQEIIKQYEIQGINDSSYETMVYVLGVLKEGEK